MNCMLICHQWLVRIFCCESIKFDCFVSEQNKGFGLKQFSEESLESTHKTLRHIREKLARKTSKKDNLRDTLRRINLPSDPILSSYNSLSMYRCSLCQEKGHTKVSTIGIKKKSRIRSNTIPWALGLDLIKPISSSYFIGDLWSSSLWGRHWF